MNRWQWRALRGFRMSPDKLLPGKLNPDEVSCPEDLLPIHDFVWAVEKLREGHKVTSEAGLRGGRRYFKSTHQAWELVSEEEMLREDWKVFFPGGTP